MMIDVSIATVYSGVFFFRLYEEDNSLLFVLVLIKYVSKYVSTTFFDVVMVNCMIAGSGFTTAASNFKMAAF